LDIGELCANYLSVKDSGKPGGMTTVKPTYTHVHRGLWTF